MAPVRWGRPHLAGLAGVRQRLVVAAAAVLCLGPDTQVPGVLGDPANEIGQDVSYIWPLALWTVPLAEMVDGGEKAKDKFPDGFAQSLAVIGEKGYRRYARKVLPMELKADPKFKAEFESRDGSRVNWAFLRWQKRVFSQQARIPVEEIGWDGKPVPRYKGIPYQWKELYESAEYKTLKKRVARLTSSYLNSLSGNQHNENWRVFIWVDAYGPGESEWPHVLTGAAAAGKFFARYAAPAKITSEAGEGDEFEITTVGAQQLVIEDPRGHSAPYGRKHKVTPEVGDLMLWPAWTSHYMSPNGGNATNIYFNFLCWPEGGPHDFDWEDDVTGDYTFKKKSTIKRGQQPQGAQLPGGGYYGRNEL